MSVIVLALQNLQAPQISAIVIVPIDDYVKVISGFCAGIFQMKLDSGNKTPPLLHRLREKDSLVVWMYVLD